MPRKAQSQWNFGELFEPEDKRKIRSVAEITSEIKSLLNRELGEVWVSGEITNFRAQSSGHCYFSLKDERAQLSCVLFRNQKIESRSALDDGQKVLLRGDLTVYEARGQYQLIVAEVELQGIGALQIQFEKLKQKLQEEGLFDPDRKRSLPQFPARIGLITSPTGAAIRDVIHVVERRNPSLQIIHAAARVQGEGAAREIASAIDRLNKYSSAMTPLDLILVTRGGGSLEDLWAFNEEVVARAIAGSNLPVISAIGHEIDFTIADFTADLRAATPSAAAELITEGVFASRRFIREARERINLLARRGVADLTDRTAALRHRLELQHPRRQLRENMQRLDDVRDDFQRVGADVVNDRRRALDALRHRLAATPLSQIIELQRQRLNGLTHRLREAIQTRQGAFQTRTSELAGRLRLLSPQNTLDRGYSITRDADSGEVIRAADKTKTGQKLKTALASGEISSEVL
jgi:exodeoxyribonuclease VII large subunit